MTLWTLRGLGVAAVLFSIIQTPTLPPALQTLGGLGTFLMGVGLTGWVALQAYKTLKHPGNNNGAERRINAAVTQILEHLDRNHELTRTEVTTMRQAVLDDVQKTRHGVIAAVTAPIIQVAADVAVVKNLLIELRARQDR